MDSREVKVEIMKVEKEKKPIKSGVTQVGFLPDLQAKMKREAVARLKAYGAEAHQLGVRKDVYTYTCTYTHT